MAKAVKLDHHHFGVAPDDPSFDIDRARAAHADVMRRWDDPKEGDAFKALMLHTIQNATAAEIETHRKEIQKFLDTYFGKKQEATAKAVVKAYVALHYDAAREVTKAEHDFWRHQQRDPQGQWTEGSFMGSPQPHMDLEQRRATLQHVAAISAATTGQGRVVYHVEDRKGRVRQERLQRHKVPRLRRGERLVGRPYGEFTGDDLHVGHNTYNLMSQLGGGDDTARRVGGGVQASSDFANAWHEHTNKEYGTNKGAGFARIGAGAEALHTIAGGHPKAAVAVAIGRYVGKHGAEAEKVLGPHARKSAYKYRGVERAPRDLPKRPEGMSEQQYRDRLTAQISRNIPTRAVHDLNLASGYTAPSHGYLIDSKGKVSVEAHGYGDDHYLPFKLNGLTRLRNGSYIRTRGTGGPTTEDIYAASISGAKDFTVTSRQGTYTLGFDEAFHHHKRFGDIALGMSKRYGKILDAVASGKVYAKGEVSDRAYQKMYQDALGQIPADDPNRNERAQKLAETMRDQQESVKGRPLTLNGEGYDYALKALQSQYPHYLHYADRERSGGDRLDARGDPTGYFGPNDRRFWEDPAAEEGGHLSRIGNRSERDSGYVKARHLKSADALLGYFDPSIEGSALRQSGDRMGHTNISEGDLTGSKLRGDVVHYQNWKHNPYNLGQTREPNTPDTPKQTHQDAWEERKRNREAQDSLNRASAAASGGQPGGVNDQNKGQGVSTAANAGLSVEQAALMAKIRAVVKHRKDNGEEPHKMLALWAEKPETFKKVYELSPESAENTTRFINNQFKPIAETTRLTNAPTDDAVRPDEVADKSDSDDSRRYNELDAHLNTPYHALLRSKLQSAGKDMWNEKNGQGNPDADPDAGWDHYHHVGDEGDPTKVLDRAFGDDPTAREDARNMMSQEVEMDDVHARLGKPHGEVYVPHAHRAQAAAQATTEPVATEKDAFAAQHNKILVQGVTHLRDMYSVRPPGEDDDERITRRRKLNDIAFTLNEIEGQESPEHVRANTARLSRLVNDHPELAHEKVLVDHPHGGGKAEIEFADLAHMYPQPTTPQHKKVHKAVVQWSVRKSGKEYVLSAI